MAAKQRGAEIAVLLLSLLVVSSLTVSHASANPLWTSSSQPSHAPGLIKSKTYLSPAIRLGPGEVSNKNYTIEFPKGHIAIKGLLAELVDAKGNPVPLHEVYLHHWVIMRTLEKTRDPEGLFSPEFKPTVEMVPNRGLCDDGVLRQYFGLGSETRRTNYAIPDPYGIVVGDPNGVPKGFEDGWDLTVHAIDTRATLDPRGCAECRCNLYNESATITIPKTYGGGLACCLDGTQCALKKGLKSLPPTKTFYLKYTVEWIDWDSSVVPVGIYVIDATDTGVRSKSKNEYLGCKVEYQVPACNTGLRSDLCVHTAESTSPALPKAGRVVYAVAHQHAGGIGSTLHKEDGSEICTSEPIYGSGKQAGDEAGYIVGMTACYPDVDVKQGGKLHMQSRYSSLRAHTGVMGLFYLLISE